jgi:phage gpG-like protein
LSDVTLQRRLDARAGTRGKRGLTKKGRAVLANAKILRDSGILQDTLRYQLTADGRGVAVGTDRVYGAMQQFGGTRAQWPHLWGDIPARPFLGLDAADRAEIVAIFRRQLAR